jgi:hypothetical protein
MTEHQIAMDKTTTTELEAAAFRRLVAHLQNRTDVQNIDMMNLAGFCRNCMSRWYREAANESGIDMDETVFTAWTMLIGKTTSKRKPPPNKKPNITNYTRMNNKSSP